MAKGRRDSAAIAKDTAPNVFLTVMDVHSLINMLEQRVATLATIKGTKRDQARLTKVIKKLYTVKWT